MRLVCFSGMCAVLLSGCTSLPLNNALGTPKNPGLPFHDPDWSNKKGDSLVLGRLYGELTKAGADPSAYNVKPEEMRPYLSAGFAISDFYCQKFFTKTDEAYRRRSFGRSVTNDVGTVVQGILNLANAGADTVAGLGLATGLADSTWRHYDAAFLISADLSNVQGLVHAAQDNFRARTLGENATLPADYSSAQSVILRYANFCSFLGMQSLLNVSATEKKQQLNAQTEVENGTTGDSKKGASPDQQPTPGSVQPPIASNQAKK